MTKRWSSRPVAASQTCTAPRSPPAARSVPSGEKARQLRPADETSFRVNTASPPSAVHVPDDDRAGQRAAGGPVAGVVEGHAGQAADAPVERLQMPARSGVPVI